MGIPVNILLGNVCERGLLPLPGRPEQKEVSGRIMIETKNGGGRCYKS